MMRNLIAAGCGLLLICSAAIAPADLVQTLDAHTAAVNTLAITPDGATMFTGGNDGYVKMWDSITFELLMDFPACQVAVNDIAVSPDGTFVATAGQDGYVKIWDALTAEQLDAIAAHEGPANRVVINAEYVISGGDDGYVRMWEIANDFALAAEFFANYSGVNDMLINEFGDYLFTGGVDGYVTVFDIMTKQMQSRIKAYENAEVLCLALNHPAPDYEPCLLTGGTNGEVRVWDAWTGSLVKTVRAHAGDVTCVACFLDDDSLFFTTGKDGKFKLWNREGELAGQMQVHTFDVRDFMMIEDLLVTCGADFKVRVWNANY